MDCQGGVHGTGAEVMVRNRGWGGESRRHFWLGAMVEILTEELRFEVGLEGWGNDFKNRKGSGRST